MNYNEFLVEGMTTFLDDQPEVLAAYTAYKRLSADSVLWEKIRARERFLTDQYLDRANAYHKGQKETSIEVAQNMKSKGYSATEIAELTGLPLSEVERLG
jgi:predicted transposase/invertase (TIGR01784 family)